MIPTKPSVQFDCSRYPKFISKKRTYGWYKKSANRAHRRDLNRATRLMMIDPDRFDNEPFEAASLSAWDLW